MQALSYLTGGANFIFMMLFLFYSHEAKDLFFGPMVAGAVVYFLVLIHPPAEFAPRIGATDFVSLWRLSGIIERMLLFAWAATAVVIVGCAFVIFRERRNDADAGVFFGQAMAYIFSCIFLIADINETLRPTARSPAY
jgi:hypothetical protein